MKMREEEAIAVVVASKEIRVDAAAVVSDLL